ncbi:aldehyde dehydrogenase family protein [Kovacikia minuta CCNUW1]|uniref:aldehyde dehydrogenase family protein n=1 Tax=Kovacikia minuta TaxID=2931930 RepID=UPI001CCEBF5A|nr:aldehyde dehydrogenase family protein [Kovacikia minuta]UBF25970.1 aldehyde dehydrogenase family protein [Kovacikia minuta CCNUW1]
MSSANPLTDFARIDPLPPTPIEQIDAIAHRLSKRKNDWLQVSISDRIAYLQRCIATVTEAAEVWAETACRAKGIAATATLAGEEWLLGPSLVLWNLQQLIKTLEANGQPKPLNLTSRNGQTVARVFPNNLMERLLWVGFKGEVWIEPGQPATQGMVYRKQPTQGKVALVLGAGNVSSIAPLDAVYKLFAEDAVVLLKMNPVNEYMGPILEAAFAPLRQDGFLAIVYGGADVGSYLSQHPLVDTIHITGSHLTHDAIVWGTTETQAERKATQRPLNPKPITSELGCVTPVIVVPGNWSKSDLAFQARHVAGMVVNNASFNCAAAKVIVTAKSWKQRGEFLHLLQQELAATPQRYAYYPGAKQRFVAFLKRYPQAQPVSSGSDEIVPWTLIPDVPAKAGEYALTQEAFCGVLAEVSLDAADIGEFLHEAVAFVNETVWGNLSCTVLIDPATQKQWTKAFEAAIAQLRYGAIGINVWSAVLFSIPALPWGAFPGNPLDDIRSGQGFVHNAYLFEHPQKSVLRAPFRIFPLPFWVARRSHLRKLGQLLTQFQAKPSWGNLLRLAIAAMKGGS